MASGVSVANECLEAYQEIKIGKQHRYLIYKLSDDLKEVIVAKKAEKTETYDDFVECVKGYGENCLYAVFDFEYTLNDMQRKKLVFVLWAPENAKVRQKMVYTSSKNALRQKLVGIGVDLQANDYSGLEIDEVLSKCCERSQ